MKIFRNVTIKNGVKFKLSRLKNRLLVLTACSFSSTYILFLLLNWNLICLNVDIQLRLNKLCKEFQEGHAFGDLCQHLCSNQISVSSCQARHKGKSTVFTAVWNKSTVVIKNPKLKSEYIPIEGTSYNSMFPSYEEFTEMVTQSIQVNFGITTDNLLPKLYPFIKLKEDITRNQMINLWELSQDNEYVSIMLNEHSTIFPKILGSCGTYYAMEYAKPISSSKELFSNAEGSMNGRIQIAKLLINLLHVLEFSFPKPLHMCDVKLEHFGLLNGRMVLLDIDTVFPKHIIDRSVADGRTCTEHTDCDFFDCRSLCNKVLQVCDTPVVNNNLQLICQKIFLDSGLLEREHLPSAAQFMLNECAYPALSSDGRQAATAQSLQKLLNFFDQFLKSTNSSALTSSLNVQTSF